MIRFLLVLLAFVSALLAFIFQEIVLFVASGGLLVVSVVLVLLQVREQSKRRNRLKLPNELTPADELRARGVLEIRPKAKVPSSSVGYAPPELRNRLHSEEELRAQGILEVREKSSSKPKDRPEEHAPVAGEQLPAEEERPQEELDIPWSAVASGEEGAAPDLFSEPAEPAAEDLVREFDSDEVEEDRVPAAESPAASEYSPPPKNREEFENPAPPRVEEVVAGSEETVETDDSESAVAAEADESVVGASDGEPAVGEASEPEAVEELSEEAPTPPVERGRIDRPPIPHRRVEVDAHLPALQTSLGAHTVCLIDVDTDTAVYRLRSIVSSGLVDHAGTEYPFSGFFLSDLLAETTILDIGPAGLALSDLRFHRDLVALKQVIAAPVMKGGLPAAFLVAGFESDVDESSQQAVERAAAFFSSLYALQEDHPVHGESPLTRAKRKPPSLRLVKSNPKSTQSKIIAEEMVRARGTRHPMAFALVCLDRGDEIARSDQSTLFKVEEWMRSCLEQITPDGRIEYLGELGYGIIQLRDVSDVEGWVRRAQQVFRSQHGPVDAHPIVGVAMLSDGHRHPEDLQADAVRALRAAYETGDSTILVG